VMDQAGWHIAQELEVPQNMRLVLLPPYSPEIHPAEHIWDAPRWPGQTAPLMVTQTAPGRTG
jgi:hypothetical protein